MEILPDVTETEAGWSHWFGKGGLWYVCKENCPFLN